MQFQDSKVGDGCRYVYLMFDGLSYHAPNVDRNFVKGCTIAGALFVHLACTLNVSCFCAPWFQLDVNNDTQHDFASTCSSVFC